MGVIIIIAVFWLLGLLMAWSMCVVAARADRHMEELHHAGGVSNGKGLRIPCLISSACHVDCAEPYGRMAGRFRDMS